MLFLEVIFVVFFLWRSLLEPEEVRAYPQSLLVLMGLCALVSIWYAWKLRKSTQAPTDEIRFNKYFSIGLFFCYLLSFHTLGFLIALMQYALKKSAKKKQLEAEAEADKEKEAAEE